MTQKLLVSKKRSVFSQNTFSQHDKRQPSNLRQRTPVWLTHWRWPETRIWGMSSTSCCPRASLPVDVPAFKHTQITSRRNKLIFVYIWEDCMVNIRSTWLKPVVSKLSSLTQRMRESLFPRRPWAHCGRTDTKHIIKRSHHQKKHSVSECSGSFDHMIRL